MCAFVSLLDLPLKKEGGAVVVVVAVLVVGGWAVEGGGRKGVEGFFATKAKSKKKGSRSHGDSKSEDEWREGKGKRMGGRRRKEVGAGVQRNQRSQNFLAAVFGFAAASPSPTPSPILFALWWRLLFALPPAPLPPRPSPVPLPSRSKLISRLGRKEWHACEEKVGFFLHKDRIYTHAHTQNNDAWPTNQPKKDKKMKKKNEIEPLPSLMTYLV
jgi:hypothetical protein